MTMEKTLGTRKVFVRGERRLELSQQISRLRLHYYDGGQRDIVRSSHEPWGVVASRLIDNGWIERQSL